MTVTAGAARGESAVVGSNRSGTHLSIQPGLDQVADGCITRRKPMRKAVVVDALDELWVKDQVDKRPGGRHAGKCNSHHNSYCTTLVWCTMKDTGGDPCYPSVEGGKTRSSES